MSDRRGNARSRAALLNNLAQHAALCAARGFHSQNLRQR